MGEVVTADCAGPAGDQEVRIERGPAQTIRVLRGPSGSEVVLQGFGGPQLGVTVADVQPGAGKEAGVEVREVTEGSAAAEAGIQKGDIIVEYDGERVRSASQFSRLVRETAPGREVSLTVLREGKRTQLKATPRDRGNRAVFLGRDFQRGLEEFGRSLGELGRYSFRLSPDTFGEWFSYSYPGFQVSSRLRLGVTLQALSPQLAEYFSVKQGALVSAVADDSPAAKAGVRAGDVITEVNGTAVNDPGDVTREIGRLRDAEKVTLTITRDRKSQSIDVPLGTERRGSAPRRGIQA